MAPKLITLAEIQALVGTRGPAGMRYEAKDEFPSYEYLMRMLHQVQQATAASAALMVCPDESAANAVYVMAGRCSIDETALAYAGGVVSGLSNNATTYIWAAKPSSIVVITKGLSGAGWPGTTHIKLAEVTLSAGIITAIVDRRPELWLKA